MARLIAWLLLVAASALGCVAAMDYVRGVWSERPTVDGEDLWLAALLVLGFSAFSFVISTLFRVTSELAEEASETGCTESAHRGDD